jgi:hypothetical protein
MRLTQGLLQEYIEAELLIKKLEAKKQEVRQAILERGEAEFSMGDFLISAKEFARTIPLPIKEIQSILGDKANSILRESKMVRVDVKKVG